MRRRTPPPKFWLPALLLVFLVVLVLKIKQIITTMPLSAAITILGFVGFGFIVIYYSRYQSGNTKRQIYQQKTDDLKRRTRIEDLYKLDPDQFVDFVEDFFEISRGFKTYQTKKTGDGGKDIIMFDEDVPIYVEVKHWKKNGVGRPIIQKLIGAMAADKIKRGYFVTSSYFTKEAILEAGKVGVILINGNELIRQINELGLSKENLSKEIEVLT